MLVPLALLFVALGVPSYVLSVEYTPFQYDLGREILLNCSGQDASALTSGVLTYTWTKNGIDKDQVEELKDRYETLEGGSVLRVIPHTYQYDDGDYACTVGEVTRAWRVKARPIALLPPEVEVVEGQTLRVKCKLFGKRYDVPVQWLHDTKPVEETSRVTLRDYELVVEGVTRADAGNYSCVPRGGKAAYTTVRVED